MSPFTFVFNSEIIFRIVNLDHSFLSLSSRLFFHDAHHFLIIKLVSRILKLSINFIRFYFTVLNYFVCFNDYIWGDSKTICDSLTENGFNRFIYLNIWPLIDGNVLGRIRSYVWPYWIMSLQMNFEVSKAYARPSPCLPPRPAPHTHHACLWMRC